MMKAEMQYLEDCGLADYLLVLQLPHHMQELIKTEVKEFSQKLGIKKFYPETAQLLLARFSQAWPLEKKVLETIYSVTQTTGPFQVKITGYGSLPTHTIFIKLDTGLIAGLIKRLKSKQKHLASINKEPHFSEKHFFALGSHLAPWQYETGWTEYCQKPLIGSFRADHLILLKKTEEQKRFTPLKTFWLEDKTTVAVQTGLF